MTELVFEGIDQIATQSKVWGRDRKRIRDVRSFVSHVIERTQFALLQEARRQLQAEPPDWSVAFKSFDETGERVKVPAVRLGISDSWHILVTKVSFSWGWFDAHRESQTIEILCPCVPILTTSADCIFHSWRRHPLLRAIFAFKAFMLAITKELPTDLSAADGADSNTRLNAHELNNSPERDLVEDFVCRSHANHLIQGTLFAGVFGLKFVNDLFAASLFLRMDSHLTRLAVTLAQYVHEGNVDIRDGDPPEHDQRFACEVSDLLINARGYQDEQATKSKMRRPRASRCPKTSSPELRVFVSRVTLFFEIFNGGFHEVDGKLVHYRKGIRGKTKRKK